MPPLKIVSPSSIPRSPHMNLTALYSRHGKKRCAFGAAAVLTASAKIIADEMCPGMVTSAPITEDLPRRLKVTVVGSLTRQTSPQLRLNLSRPRAPLTLPQPSRPPLSCVMALRSRVTPTQTPADQVRSRCHLLLLRDGSKTVPHPYHCLRHYPTDAPLLLQLTPTHRKLILDRHCDRATPLSPLSLPPRTEMTHRPGRQFRGVEKLVQETRTYGCSVPVAIAPPTDMLPRVWVPLGSVLAWSACLLFTNSLLMAAVVMPTPK